VSGTTTVDAHLDRRIRGYMAKVPVCVADAGGDDQLFEAACHLVRGFSISPAAAYPYLAEYNGRCLPPWNDDRLWHKLTQAEGSSIREPGYLLSRERESQPRGYDNLTPAEAAEIFARHQAEPLAPPEPCPHAAAAEVLEMLEPTCQCANPRMMIGKRPSTGRRGVVPFGCHRDRCPRCGGQKRHDLFDGTQSYILRRTAADAPGGPMSLHARVIPADREEAVKDYVRAHNGKYLIIPTADPAGCREHLDPDLRQGRGAPCLKSGSGGASLCLVLMPTGMVAPPDLAGGDVSPAGTAGVFRAIGNALTTPVKPPAGVKRVRSWMKSRDWGDKPPREPGDFVPEGQSRFKKDTPEIVEEIGIDSPFPFADPTIVGEAVGLDAGPAQSLAVSLLLRGVVGLRGPKKKDQVIRPEKDQVIRLGQDWIKAIPADVGDGPRVENVLRLQLWRGPNDGIVDRLREAARLDAEQRDAELPRQAELGSLLKSFDRLLWSYCGREHAAGPVLSCLIEPLQRTRRWRKLRKMLARPQPTLNA
jgi:hypothetical protein